MLDSCGRWRHDSNVVENPTDTVDRILAAVQTFVRQFGKMNFTEFPFANRSAGIRHSYNNNKKNNDLSLDQRFPMFFPSRHTSDKY